MIVRLLIWGIFESKTTIDELRESLPELEAPNSWIWNDAGERFGVIAFGDDMPDGVERARDLIGEDPDLAEEFDILEA